MAHTTTDTPVLDLLATMTEASIQTSHLEADELMLVRLAALVAVDAPPASYLLNLGVRGRGRSHRRRRARRPRGRCPDRRHRPDRVGDGQDREGSRVCARWPRRRRRRRTAPR